MTQEEKNLLIRDLCARLPYNCMVSIAEGGIDGIKWADVTLNSYLFHQITEEDAWEYVKPYLHPMSSMTEKEKDDLLRFFSFPLGAMYFNPNWGYVEVFKCIDEIKIYIDDIVGLIDFLNKNMFDYRGLIPKGLALEAPEGMYNK